MSKSLLFFLVLVAWIFPGISHAAEPTFKEPAFSETVFKAEIVSAEIPQERVIEGFDVTQKYQLIKARILEGARVHEVISIENDTPQMVAVGDVLYLHRLPGLEGEADTWTVGEPDRSGVLMALLALFVVTTIAVAGTQGARSLVALAGSFALIIFALVPALAAGWAPVLTSIVLGVLILAFSMFVTHGVNKPTMVALGASILALCFSAALAQCAVYTARLSGFVSDETVFLNFATAGTLNLTGLLLGGILVGIIGVLNDVSVSQVHTVIELHDANNDLTRSQVWKKSMKVGKEHMAAVVNTLPLAYAGVSLPLLLLFSQSDAPFSFIVNRELFSAEIIRAFAGSIGLILSGAIATGLAVLVLVPKKGA